MDKAYIDKDADEGIQQYHNAHRKDLDPEYPDLENPPVLRQDAELDQPDRDRVHQLVRIPVLEGWDQDLGAEIALVLA